MKFQSAFTLVEMSIVLVVVGLLAGGVLTGQTLIHSAELRSVTTEFNKYNTALGAFIDKYRALPGDMPNAVTFWGAAAGGTAAGVDSTCISLSTPSAGQATCNGNGDGFIGYGDGSSPPVLSEPWRAWQQLANAGLVEGHFSGVMSSNCGGEGACALTGENVPKSRFGQAGWSFNGTGGTFGGNLDVPSFAGNSIIFAKFSSGNPRPDPVIKPEDLYNIDKKMDDGKSTTGNVIGNFTDGLCVLGSDYNLADTTPSCRAAMQLSY